MTRRLVSAAAALVVGLALLVSPHLGAERPYRSPEPLPSYPPGATVLLAVGDVGTCQDTNDEAVAALATHLPGSIALLGDVVYPDGGLNDYMSCFNPAWGPLRARIHPARGTTTSSRPTCRVTTTTSGPRRARRGRAGTATARHLARRGAQLRLPERRRVWPGLAAAGIAQGRPRSPSRCLHPRLLHHPLYSSPARDAPTSDLQRCCRRADLCSRHTTLQHSRPSRIRHSSSNRGTAYPVHASATANQLRATLVRLLRSPATSYR